MSNPIISIIVPIYNSEKNLNDLLTCLINQTLKEIEIILINDGSTDCSGEICEKFKTLDKRIKVIHKKNTGVSNTRNVGIENAKGLFIGFVDSDDLINIDMFEKMYKIQKRFNSDVVMCDFYSERLGKNMGFPWTSEMNFNKEKIKSILIPEMVGNERDHSNNIPIWGSVCRCIFRHKIIKQNNLIFPEDIQFAEDLVFTLNTFVKCDNITVITETLYIYKFNKKSLMNSYNKYEKNMLKKRKKLYLYINKCIKENGLMKYCQKRLDVTWRQYIITCVGNCTRNCTRVIINQRLKELKCILNDIETIKAFNKIKYKHLSTKQKILYFLIKYKATIILFSYYRIRNKN